MHKAKMITRDESRYLLLKHVADLVTYWENEERHPSSREKLEGLAFSILSGLDGCSMGLPGFFLVPNATEEDVAYAIKQGFDWHRAPSEKESEILNDLDIGGSLHEEIHRYLRDEVSRPENLHDFGHYLAKQAKAFR